MNLIICLDDKNGIRFNGRRQSSDRLLCERILDAVGERSLWMNAYSAKLFPSGKAAVCENFLSAAKAGEFCFSESSEFLHHLSDIEKVIVYRWNRVYPSDVKIDTSFLKKKRLVGKVDFVGSSHEKITEEIYE